MRAPPGGRPRLGGPYCLVPAARSSRPGARSFDSSDTVPTKSAAVQFTARAAALAALLVLGLGVARVLVFCSGPHCAGRTDFASAACSCCTAEDRDGCCAPRDGCCGGGRAAHGERDTGAPAPKAPGEVATKRACDCTAVALHLEQGPPPDRMRVDLPDGGAAVPAPRPTLPHAHAERSAVRPPSTGPPRIGDLLEHRRSILLLL
jgi:hypothetical protein